MQQERKRGDKNEPYEEIRKIYKRQGNQLICIVKSNRTSVWRLANKKRERPLSMDETIVICKFLEVNPMDFEEPKTAQEDGR